MIENAERYVKSIFGKIRHFFSSIDWEDIKERLLKEIKLLRWTPIDRYVLNSFLISLFGSLFFFVCIYQLTVMFQDIKWIPQGTRPELLFKYYIFNGIYWIVILQPFSFLFATVYVLSRMAQFRELVAIVSSGTSIYRVSFYMIVFTLLYYLFMMLYFQNFVIFPCYQKKHILGEIVFQRADPKSLDRLRDNHNFSIFGSGDLIYIIGYYNAVSRELNNITIIQLKKGYEQKNISVEEIVSNQNEWLRTNVIELTKQRSLDYLGKINISLRIDADKAIWDQKNKQWLFNSGTIRYVEDSGNSFAVQTFTNVSFPFVTDPPYYFERSWYGIDAMTYEEGGKYVEKLRKSRQDYREALARHLSKFSYSLGIIFVVLAGIGIVDMSRRKISFIINLMISMALFVVYYLLFAMGIALAGKGVISPVVGAYVGTIFLGVSSIFIFRFAKT